MSSVLKSENTFVLELNGQSYTVRRIKIPFREGVELEVELADRTIRVSDRQLGESEALRLLKAELSAVGS